MYTPPVSAQPAYWRLLQNLMLRSYPHESSPSHQNWELQPKWSSSLPHWVIHGDPRLLVTLESCWNLISDDLSTDEYRTLASKTYPKTPFSPIPGLPEPHAGNWTLKLMMDPVFQSGPLSPMMKEQLTAQLMSGLQPIQEDWTMRRHLKLMNLYLETSSTGATDALCYD